MVERGEIRTPVSAAIEGMELDPSALRFLTRIEDQFGIVLVGPEEICLIQQLNGGGKGTRRAKAQLFQMLSGGRGVAGNTHMSERSLGPRAHIYEREFLINHRNNGNHK